MHNHIYKYSGRAQSKRALCRAFATETTSECEVLRLDCDTLGMNGSKIRVFEQRDEVRLSGLLQRHDSGRLEAEIGLGLM